MIVFANVFVDEDDDGSLIFVGQIESLPSEIESFFGISVLKGEAETSGGQASRQIAALAARSAQVPRLDMQPALDWLKAGRPTDGFESFRDLARQAGGG